MDSQHGFFIAKAKEELQYRRNNITQIILNAHNIRYEHDEPVVVNVLYIEEMNFATVSFELEEVDFYLSIIVHGEEDHTVTFAASQYKITLLASAEKGLEELLSMTVLIPDGWEDRDDSINEDGEYEDESAVYFEPNQGWGGFAEKMDKMLTYLETDVAGVQKLVAEADAFLQVTNCYHVRYIQNEEVELDLKTMERLVALGLNVRFEHQGEGEFFEMGNGWMG